MTEYRWNCLALYQLLIGRFSLLFYDWPDETTLLESIAWEAYMTGFGSSVDYSRGALYPGRGTHANYGGEMSSRR
jgi:hypothetical protein